MKTEQKDKPENKHTKYDLAQMQSLPLEAKIRMSRKRVTDWYEGWTRFDIFDKAKQTTRFEVVFTSDSYAQPILKDTEYILSAETGQVYVSFSGGKDSTVVADICARICQMYGYTLYLLFVNTGLEYPEIQMFVKAYAEWLRRKYYIDVVLDIVRPEMRFDEVIKTYGYPAVSKEVSKTVWSAKHAGGSGKYKEVCISKLKGEFLQESGNPSLYNCEKWQFLLDAPFEVSPSCCDVMKKRPAKQYSKQTGRRPIIGTLANESRLRTQQWIRYGCNSFEGKTQRSAPLSFWTEQDILQYIKKYNIPICSVYGDIVYEEQPEQIRFEELGLPELPLGTEKLKLTGCQRTGCIFCMFGCHLEDKPNRFQMLNETHPRQYQYCIGGGEMVDGVWQPNKQGLGLGKVLDYIGVDYE